MSKRTNTLKIVGVNNFSQTINGREYAMVECTTSDNKTVEVALTHNFLERKGVDLTLLDELTGSSITIGKDEYRAGGTGIAVITSAEDRIANVVEGKTYTAANGDEKTYSFILTNSNNISNFVKGEIYKDATVNIVSSTLAKVKIEEKRLKGIAATKANAEKLRALSENTTKPVEEKEEEFEEEIKEEPAF